MTQDQAEAEKPVKPARKAAAKAPAATESSAAKSTQTIDKPSTNPKVAPARARPAKSAEPAPEPAATMRPAAVRSISKKGAPPDMTATPQAAAKTAPEPDDEIAVESPAPKETPAAVERDAMPPPGPRPMLPQRAIAKAENFKAGDHVVYPTHGVGKVERIAAEEIAGQKLELIHITFDENRMTLRVPVNKARTAGLRKLSGRKQFDEVLAALKGRARVKRTMWSRRAQEYEAKINSGDPMAIAEVVRDLHRNAGQPDQSFSERQIFEAALERLAAEYGALEGLGKQEAIDKLLLFLKSE
ncbi:transcriptional regulator, CarD family [Acidiphilium rubrum]|uniref:Transcriptional regulator, CarD family n=2 Tax=Acidocellaceae TaxID=3385905 RepID=A0A8G2CMP0_ACIRU|nr:transcriptional regulator, CarD family [Acidiphilium rubrum]